MSIIVVPKNCEECNLKKKKKVFFIFEKFCVGFYKKLFTEQCFSCKNIGWNNWININGWVFLVYKLLRLHSQEF